MLGAAAAILLCLLPSQANGLLTAVARCLPGYEALYSSIGQSPCDVAVELASVCYGATYQVQPLPVVNESVVYDGPSVAAQNGCLCSSVYYSMLSACSWCQYSGVVNLWSLHRINCVRAYVQIYPEPIPAGVRVPGYAYRDVLTYDRFNISLAFSVRGIESSGAPLPTSSTQPTSTFSSTPSASASTASSGGTTKISSVVIGGIVVGTVVGLGLLAALIIFLVLRSKQKSQSRNYQQRPNSVGFTLDAKAPLVQSTIPPPPGSPGMVYNPNDQIISAHYTGRPEV